MSHFHFALAVIVCFLALFDQFHLASVPSLVLLSPHLSFSLSHFMLSPSFWLVPLWFLYFSLVLFGLATACFYQFEIRLHIIL